jgi:hypothetical protein
MIAVPKTPPKPVSLFALLKAQPCRKTVLQMVGRGEVKPKVANRYLRELSRPAKGKRFGLLDLVREEVDTGTLCQLVREEVVAPTVAVEYLRYRRSAGQV